MESPEAGAVWTIERQIGQPLQARNGEISGLALGENRLNDVGAETRERQDSADLCWIEAFR
jgi:hypothetical protein